MSDGDAIQSLRRQLSEAEENLRLIQERKAQYVMEVDIPLQLIRRERRLEVQIAGLREQLDPLAQAQLDADMDRLRARRDRADQARRELRERQRVVNLRPLDVTHTFRDRVREMRALCDHLADGSVRLVSIVGRGGMGKTALASRVLADLERGILPTVGEQGEDRELPIDGILYLGARSTGLGLERIYADVGRMLGEPAASRLATHWASREVPLAARVDYLLETMQDGLYLILLDNLEGVLAEDGDIAEEGLRLFVERCLTLPAGARLIATSREQVKLAAAALRGARTIPLREGLPEGEAVALLRDLDPQGELGLGDAAEDDLRRATQLTQGVPRALEILAGILHEDPTTSLYELLDDERLFGERVVERLVAEGYRRLAESERRIMEALAVFDRPVEETSIAYLLHPWYPGLDVRAGLRHLARGYFVSVNRVTGEYSLHPLDREYAYGQLPDDGEPNIYNRRSLEMRAAEFYASIRKPESECKSLDDLAPQLAEFEHRVRAGDCSGACRLLEPLDYPYLFKWGHYARLVEMRERLQDGLADPGLQADNLGGLGLAYHALGRFEQAIKLYEQALPLARGVSDQAGEGRHLRNLASAYRDVAQYKRAIEFYEYALSIAHQLGNREDEGVILGNLGNTYHYLGQGERAIAFYEQAITIYREVKNRRREGAELGNLSNTYRALRQSDRAIELYEKALVIACEVDDRRAECAEYGGLGNAYRDLGKIEQAVKLYDKALTIAREIGARDQEGLQCGRLGIAYLGLGQIEKAVEHYEEALAIACDIGHRRYESAWLSWLGHTCHVLGQAEQAIDFYKESLHIASVAGHRGGKSSCLLGLSQALLVTKAVAKARQCCAQALALDVLTTGYQAALVLGIILLHQHDPDAGKTFVDAAARSHTLLDQTADLYEPRYALAAALVGQAVCDPRWAEESKRASLLAPALAEYRRALEITAAKGIVQDALRDLELISRAGIEGLAPAFELLEGALASDA